MIYIFFVVGKKSEEIEKRGEKFEADTSCWRLIRFVVRHSTRRFSRVDKIFQLHIGRKTFSIFTCILILFLQISTLIQHRSERTHITSATSERTLRAIGRVGQAVNLAVERFVTVGETIADDNPDIKQDMYDACKEARAAGEHSNSNWQRKKQFFGFICRRVRRMAAWIGKPQMVPEH